MNNVLLYKQSNTTLLLSGTLNSESLVKLWKNRALLLRHVKKIDISGLKYIDSTGVAMLVRLKGEFESKTCSLNIIGINDNFTTLIKLYGLESLLIS
ncbi:hypothetical protein GFV14_00520 [Candidatus Hartigia pinicola]|nr:hypothetical protein GFV14_00520 [Candidatus Hartigia pinicola]